jgi:hypothetical protein
MKTLDSLKAERDECEAQLERYKALETALRDAMASNAYDFLGFSDEAVNAALAAIDAGEGGE